MMLVERNPPANTGDIRDAGSIPGSGRSPGVGYGNPLQYLAWRIPMDRGAWQAKVYGLVKSQTRLKRELAHVQLHFKIFFKLYWWHMFLIETNIYIIKIRANIYWALLLGTVLCVSTILCVSVLKTTL